MKKSCYTAILAEISWKLRSAIQGKLTDAGSEVAEARISHLAFAPEIAANMLRRQQASAVNSARTKIVEGANSAENKRLALRDTQKIKQLQISLPFGLFVT